MGFGEFDTNGAEVEEEPRWDNVEEVPGGVPEAEDTHSCAVEVRAEAHRGTPVDRVEYHLSADHPARCRCAKEGFRNRAVVAHIQGAILAHHEDGRE